MWMCCCRRWIRIETVLRDSGYYRFNKDFVYYEVDSCPSEQQVSITLGIQELSGKG